MPKAATKEQPQTETPAVVALTWKVIDPKRVHPIYKAYVSAPNAEEARRVASVAMAGTDADGNEHVAFSGTLRVKQIAAAESA